MKKRFLPALVVVLTTSGVFGGVSIAADIAAPVVGQAAAAPASAKMAIQPVAVSGGWSKFEQLSTGDRAVFNEALTNLSGVVYEPLAVSKQVVAGMNYDFFCNARVVAPNANWYPAVVQIYKPLKGKASITKITRIETH
jgi:hypothetical protein